MDSRELVSRAYQEAVDTESLRELLAARQLMNDIIDFATANPEKKPRAKAMTLSEARDYTGLTIREAAKKMGMKPARLEAIENRTTQVTLETMFKIIEAYNFNYDHITWTGEKRPVHPSNVSAMLLFATMFNAGRIWEREQSKTAAARQQ